jgi:hypothetical protein
MTGRGLRFGDRRARRRLSRQHAPSDHGDRRTGALGRIPVPLRTGGKIVASR